jgi:glycosyltransferase involved in cell wall biosynthesis
MLISIVVPTFCEEASLRQHYRECMKALSQVQERLSLNMRYEYLIIDNCSTDDTVKVALELRSVDRNVKLYVNDRNYGPVFSPFEGLMLATGDFVMLIAADLQEPPSLLADFLDHIIQGYDAVVGYKAQSNEPFPMWILRGMYYRTMAFLGLPIMPYRYSGFGLYGRQLIEKLRDAGCTEPSLRILLPQHTRSIHPIPYFHQTRFAGRSTYSLYLYGREALKNIARNANSFHRLAGKIAIIIACVGFAIAPLAIMFKLTFWKALAPGLATILILLLISNSIILGFIALVLDRQELIIKSLLPRRVKIRHSAIHT